MTTPTDQDIIVLCKGCNEPIKDNITFQNDHSDINDDTNEWFQLGYCSFACFNNDLRINKKSVVNKIITDKKPEQSKSSKDSTIGLDDVFARTEKMCEGTRITSRLYNLLIGLTLVWGFSINWLMVKYIPYEFIANINSTFFFIGYLVLVFVGVSLFSYSSVPAVSFAGYNLVVIPFGLVINYFIYQFDSSVVIEAIRLTGFVTLTMMIMGTLYPGFFVKIRNALAISLLIVIVVELIEIFIFGIHHNILNWIIVFIFSGYIGYDWARANSIPKTVDNAIDSAAALYIDIINLFLRILSLLGGDDD